jgi:hypothetical protein
MAERESKTTSLPSVKTSQPHRRHDRFRRGVFDLTRQVAQQNEQIIELLKEIRDRLPQK